MSDVSYPRAQDVAHKVAISASMALATMIVDFAWFMGDEIKYVWSKLRTSRTARLYIVVRYLGLASQIYNVYFTVRMYLGVHTSLLGCRVWFLYQAIVVQFLLLLVQGLLMHRIYALFDCDRLVLVVLLSFVFCQIASLWVSARLSHPSTKYTATCLIVEANPRNALFSATTLTTSVVIFIMTFWRYLRLPGEWARHNLGRVVFVVFRDSALSLGAIALTMLFFMLSSLQVIKTSMSGNLTYYWLVCILWVSFGRIIVNHAKIPREAGQPEDGSIWSGILQLTSQIEMGESISSTDTQDTLADGQTHTSGTLQTSLSIPTTKASELSPSSPMSDTSQGWFADCPPGLVHKHGRRISPQSLKLSASIRRLSQSDVGTSPDSASPTEDCPRADTAADEPVRSPSPSQSPKSSELPSSEA